VYMIKNKKHIMQEQMKYFAAILFLLIFLPILGTMLLSGKNYVKLSQKDNIEQLLPSILYREIPDHYQLETICAQAVLVRSRVWYEYEKSDYDQKVYDQILKENMEYERSHHLQTDRMLLCKEAVKKTKGCVLGYGGRIVSAPFCRASNGWTRSGKEVLKRDDYGWLVGVESKPDLDYMPKRKPLSFSNDELYEKLKKIDKDQKLKKDNFADHIAISSEDSSGYAMEVEVFGIKIPGEVFRDLLGLPSASFSISKRDDKILITCRGSGHGMGMSQYGADQMAKGGKSWRDILNYYFPNTQVMKDKKK